MKERACISRAWSLGDLTSLLSSDARDIANKRPKTPPFTIQINMMVYPKNTYKLITFVLTVLTFSTVN